MSFETIIAIVYLNSNGRFTTDIYDGVSKCNISFPVILGCRESLDTVVEHIRSSKIEQFILLLQISKPQASSQI